MNEFKCRNTFYRVTLTENKQTFETLKEKYDNVLKDIAIINNMKLSNDNKERVLEELETRRDGIKYQMHQYIDTL